jgi:hypothetical protein
MTNYCNIWKVALKLDNNNYISPSESDLEKMSYTLNLLYKNNNYFADMVKNGDLIENTYCKELGSNTMGIYIISKFEDNLEILNLSTTIDNKGYIPKKFSNIVLKNSLNYWHDIEQISKNVYIIKIDNIIKDNLSFSWANSLVPISFSFIKKIIKRQDFEKIKLQNHDKTSNFILNIIKIENNKIGIISRESNIFYIDKIFKKNDGKFYDKNDTNYIDMDDPTYDVSIEDEIEYYYYTKNNNTFNFESEIESDGWIFEDFEKLVNSHIDINKCLFKLTNNITEVTEVIELDF